MRRSPQWRRWNTSDSKDSAGDGIAGALSAADPGMSARTHSRARTAIAVVAAACLGAAALAFTMMAQQVPYFPSDVSIMKAVQSANVGALAFPLYAMNRVGFPPLVGIVYVSVIIVIFMAGRKWEATSAGFAVAGSATINNLTKAWVDRPRPSPQLVHVEHLIANPSYPAGHVLNFTTFAGFLCFLVYVHMRPSMPRAALMGILLAMIALMGLARIDSGEHWPSDVLGGYLLGSFWLVVSIAFYELGQRRFAGAGPHSHSKGRGHVLGMALMVYSPFALTCTAQAASPPADSLGASVGVPWNPSQPMSRRRGWEHAVLLPGRLVSLPLSGLGYATDHTLLWLSEKPRFANGMARANGAGERALVLGTPKLGDRTGLGAAVEVRRRMLGGKQASTLSVRHAATLNKYNRTAVTWTGQPMGLQYGYDWRPQDRFYGVGNQSSQDSVSDYALQSEFVRGSMRWDSNPARDPARSRSTFTISAGPASRVTRTGRESGAVSFDERFPVWGLATLDRRVEHFVYGVSLASDHRTGSPHWSRGWRTLLSADRFDAPIGLLALHTANAEGAQFTRYQAQAEAGISFMRDPRSVRLLVRITDLNVDSNPGKLLISDLSSLGGQAGLAGYSPGRFQDRDLLLTRLAYVFPLERRLEMELHSEWGAVYPDLWSDAKLTTLHHSAGLSLRVRDDHAPRASIGFDFSREVTRLRFSIGGVE